MGPSCEGGRLKDPEVDPEFTFRTFLALVASSVVACVLGYLYIGLFAGSFHW